MSGYTSLSVCHAFTWGCKVFMGIEQLPIRVMMAMLFSSPCHALSKKLCNLLEQPRSIIFSPFGYKTTPSFRQLDIFSFAISPPSVCNSIPSSSFGSDKISPLQTTMLELKAKLFNRRPHLLPNFPFECHFLLWTSFTNIV